MNLDQAYEYDLSPLADGGMLSASHCQTGARQRLKTRLELNDPDIQRRRHDRFQIPGIEATDYRELVIALDTERSVCVGIRFLNLEVSYPFLDVWPNWPLQSASELQEIATAVTPEFKKFRPRSLAVWLRAGQIWTPEISDQMEFGQHILTAPYSRICQQPRPPALDGFSIRPFSSMEFYAEYAAEYAQFHTERPDLKDRVPIVDSQELEPSVRAGLAFEAIYEGKRAGLIAAREEDLAGQPGIYFLEILTYRAFRGRGWAPLLQRSYIDAVARRFAERPEGNRLLFWGTIDSRNQSSLRTAQRVGRTIVSTEYFFKL